MRNERGIILIVVISLLSILVMVTVMFLAQSRVYNAVNTSVLNQVRARLIARSGMEYAFVHLSDDILYPQVPYSGGLRGTRSMYGDVYSLKIRDLSASININDTNEIFDSLNASAQPGRLERMINNLCISLNNKNPGMFSGNEGTIIQDARPLGEDTKKCELYFR